VDKCAKTLLYLNAGRCHAHLLGVTEHSTN